VFFASMAAVGGVFVVVLWRYDRAGVLQRGLRTEASSHQPVKVHSSDDAEARDPPIQVLDDRAPAGIDDDALVPAAYLPLIAEGSH